ncbi:hypothetical protein HY478_00225 [Candidatus Uhrbacteria bacterium]|nr:hypothetical protein [Candidatus Uhrbacteria bacterium]
MMALADHMRKEGSYPLARPGWHEIGLTDDGQIARLETTGWLRSAEGGEVAFAHDRLLNWAVAKALVRKFQRKELSVENLGTLLIGESDRQERRSIRRLGYVPMDTLWLLAADKENSEKLGQLIALLEESHEFGSHGENLYVHFLPTLGQRAVPLLLERLRAITSASNGDYRVNLIGKAFTDLARQEGVEMEEAINSLLNSPSRDQQAVAIAALTSAPNSRNLDRLWELHQQRLDSLEDKTDGWGRLDYQASFAALRAGIERDPEWLRHRIFASDAEREPVSVLAYLLNGLEHQNAPEIWRATCDVLMAKVSTSKPRSLLYCIARFSDLEKLDFVVKHLSLSDDFASGAALTALTILDPVEAIRRLVEVTKLERDMTRNQWLPVLLRAQPEITRQRIRELAETEPKGRQLIENLYWERPNELDEATLRFLLRALETDLHEHLDDAIAGDPIWLFHPLDFVGRIARPDLLTIIEAEVGSELERMITTVACSRLRNNSNYSDHVRESARRVLILMGGEGITKLINRELQSEHFWVRHGGLNCAFMRADEGIIERLTAIARRPIPRDDRGEPESNPYMEFYQAITALAALGCDAALVEILWNSGMAEVPINLADLRAHRGPMQKTLTARALKTMESASSAEDALVTALVISWLSGDADLIPAVRSILERAEPESRAAGYACIALQELGDQSEDFVRLAARLVQTKANATSGMNALIKLGERGVTMLGNWLKGRSSSEPAEIDVWAIRALYDRAATRKLAIDIAVDRCVQERFMQNAPYDIAAEAGEPSVREQILDKAYSGRSFMTTLPLRAIEGLAKFDVTRAIEAIEIGLHTHSKIERDLCRLLVRIAPEAAATKLINAATSIDRDSLRRAVGRELRRLDPTIVALLVSGRLSGSSFERKAIAEVAGWLPMPAIAEALGHLADNDSAREARYSALAALDRHRREESTRALLAAFPLAGSERRWSLLIAILELADPYLLTDREDPLWLGQILTDNVPAAFAEHAESVLRQRKQKEN